MVYPTGILNENTKINVLCCTRGVLTLESVDNILICDHSNESYRAERFSGTVRFLTFHKTIFEKFTMF